MAQLLHWLDAVLIWPYRLPESGPAGFWLGTMILSLWAALLGQATFVLARRLNQKTLDQKNRAMLENQRRSLNALKSGDKKAYKGINALANDAFGEAFFMSVALGAASLWPLAVAAAWLEERFADVMIPLPLVGWKVNYLGGLILCYLVVRVGLGLLRVWIKRGGGGKAASGP